MKKNRYIIFSSYLLVPLAIFLFFLFVANFSYLNISTSEKSLGSFVENFRFSLEIIKKSLQNQIEAKPIDVEKIDIPTFYLYVRKNNIDKLNAALPKEKYFGITHAPKDYVPGDLVWGNKTFRADVRYRGDNFFHWRFPKKSWRVKLEDKKILNGSNKLNLINPKFDSHMSTQLSYDIAKSLGVLAPRSYHIVVYLNNKYAGVYYFTDQIDETFLRTKGLLPGDIFQGEIQDSFNYLFNDSTYWEKIAEKDDSGSKEDLDFFLKSINSENDMGFYEFFDLYIGNDYLKFLALRTIISSYQPDQFHNQKWYVDPSSRKFIPIAWDLVPYENNEISLNYYNNPLAKKVLLNPELVHRKNLIIYNAINGDLSKENLIKRVEEYKALIDYEMKADKNKDSMEKPYVLTYSDWEKSVEELKKDITDRHDFIKGEMENVKVSIFILNNQTAIDVYGENAVVIKSNNSLNNKILYPGRKIHYEDLNDIFINEASLSTQRYFFKDIDLSDLVFFNAVTGSKISPKVIYISSNNKDDIPNIEISDSAIVENRSILPDRVLNESINLKKDLVVNDLVINPGTAISLDPGVSIIVYGKIFAKGTKEEPIILKPSTKIPWGALVIQNRGNKEKSVFSYCTIKEGSGVTYEGIHYSGMVSVYNSNASFDNCIFESNRLEDDMFNSKYADIKILNSKFIDAFSDAIDFDITTGFIKNSEFKNSGGDSIDLMTSKEVLLENNIIISAKDKGISIGENSYPFVLNNTIKDSVIGIAIKDMSYPLIESNIFINNEVAISAYHKNWRFEYGARGTLIDNKFKNNKVKLDIDNPNLTISNSSIIKENGVYKSV